MLLFWHTNSFGQPDWPKTEDILFDLMSKDEKRNRIQLMIVKFWFPTFPLLISVSMFWKAFFSFTLNTPLVKLTKIWGEMCRLTVPVLNQKPVYLLPAN